MLCDTLKTPSEGEEESKEEATPDTLQTSTSSPDSTRAESPRDESDASSDWRSSQAVEETTVLPPSMDSASEEVKQFQTCHVLIRFIIVFFKGSLMK